MKITEWCGILLWYYIYEYLTFWGMCIVIYLYNRSQQDALFLNFILIYNSTCFGQTYCPSSGILLLYSQQTVNISSMTNTSCFEYSIKTPDDGQWVCPKHVELYVKVVLRNSASGWLLLYKSVSMPFSLKWFLLLSVFSHVSEHSNITLYLLLLWVLLWIQTAMSSVCNDSRWLGMGYLHQKFCYFLIKISIHSFYVWLSC